MDQLFLVRPTMDDLKRIEAYRSEFSPDRARVTYDPDRIPGLDYLENYTSIADWLHFCAAQEGRISWYLTIRQSDGAMVGACCLRHRLEYDDDDIDFASHIGYSIRPSEQGKGYSKEQLRLALDKAWQLGIDPVRIICRDLNERSRRTILSNGGTYIDTIYGTESGLRVERYDIYGGNKS